MIEQTGRPRRNYPELYILRHGQTEWNAAGRMQGSMDSPLTRLGREQAAMQGRILRSAGLSSETTYHCSPQGRARQTAELALAGLTDTPRFDNRLREVSVGEFEGVTLKDLENDWPDLMGQDSPFSWHYRSPGGEGFGAFQSRISDWLEEITGPAVVVTHGMVSGVLRGLVLGLGPDGIAKLPGGQGVVYHVRDGVHRRLEA